MATDTPGNARYKTLTKTQCMHLFCDIIGYGKDSYYKYHRDFIKFRPTAYEVNENGQTVGKMHRIPERIALGMINWLQGEYSPETDPPMQRIMKYMAKIPAQSGQV